MPLVRIDPSNFTWTLWRAGSLYDLGIEKYRYAFILEKKTIIKKYAIGYCDAENLLCRPKKNCSAVMFQKNSNLFWTHLTNKEFTEIFYSG